MRWCWLVAGRLTDVPAVNRYRRWAVIDDSPATQPPFARVTTAMTQTLPPSVFDDYALLYRRPVPTDLIVDSLPRMGWQDRP